MSVSEKSTPKRVPFKRLAVPAENGSNEKTSLITAQGVNAASVTMRKAAVKESPARSGAANAVAVARFTAHPEPFLTATMQQVDPINNPISPIAKLRKFGQAGVDAAPVVQSLTAVSDTRYHDHELIGQPGMWSVDPLKTTLHIPPLRLLTLTYKSDAYAAFSEEHLQTDVPVINRSSDSLVVQITASEATPKHQSSLLSDILHVAVNPVTVGPKSTASFHLSFRIDWTESSSFPLGQSWVWNGDRQCINGVFFIHPISVSADAIFSAPVRVTVNIYATAWKRLGWRLQFVHKELHLSKNAENSDNLDTSGAHSMIVRTADSLHSPHSSNNVALQPTSVLDPMKLSTVPAEPLGSPHALPLPVVRAHRESNIARNGGLDSEVVFNQAPVLSFAGNQLGLRVIAFPTMHPGDCAKIKVQVCNTSHTPLRALVNLIDRSDFLESDTSMAHSPFFIRASHQSLQLAPRSYCMLPIKFSAPVFESSLQTSKLFSCLLNIDATFMNVDHSSSQYSLPTRSRCKIEALVSNE
jgi:hypothetical protein